MALENKDKFFEELFEMATRDVNMEEITALLTSDYNKDYYAGMDKIRQTIKENLAPMFKSLSNYDVYQMAMYTCHTPGKTLIDSLFDELEKTKDPKERTILRFKIALCQYCDDQCAIREGRPTYEDFLKRERAGKVMKDLEKERRNVERVERVAKKDPKKGLNLFQRLFGKKNKEAAKNKEDNETL